VVLDPKPLCIGDEQACGFCPGGSLSGTFVAVSALGTGER
jgi:hypothetical protein